MNSASSAFLLPAGDKPINHPKKDAADSPNNKRCVKDAGIEPGGKRAQ